MQDALETNFMVRSEEENTVDNTGESKDVAGDKDVDQNGNDASVDSGNPEDKAKDDTANKGETLQAKATKLGIVNIAAGTYAKFSKADLEVLKALKNKDGKTLKYTFDENDMPVLTAKQKLSNDFVDYYVNTGTVDAPTFASQPDALFDYQPTGLDGVEKKSYFRKEVITSSNGFVEEYHNSNDDYCTSYVLIPGTSLLPKPLLGVTYFIFLCFLFLGISIIADMFMEAIETITSKVQLVERLDEKTQTKY